MVEREDLTKRTIPEMELSDVNKANSKTIGHDPFTNDLSPSDGAVVRFKVAGNVIITGGTGTLALAAARAFLEQGASGLALLDLNPDSEAAVPIISGLRSRHPQQPIVTVACNVTDAESVREAVAKAAEQLGPIRHLAHFAGVVSCVHAMDMPAEEWNRVMSVNTTGAFNAAQAVARHVRGHGQGGSIVFIASMSGHSVNYPQPQAAYNVSKAAVIHLVHCLAAEWAVHGIRVNSVSPGYADTILNAGEGLQRCRDIWASRNPMGRMALPHEIAGPTVMLCSNAGSYINGADIVVDGGATVF
ncbi:Enoyl-(Acyl carrier protein) reductase-like protein 3 [Elsinoe fawcettii]|nr:Enoyl-(Acyl carrier protein) reductase-like protein 3 [Elsinoe fawcettii]